MSTVHPFREQLKTDYDKFLNTQLSRFPQEDVMRIDLHCHDYNSDVPDELWGRILRLPETWLKSQDLLECLKGHGADVFTITNHNNARSCWEMEDKGHDILPGSEFTCHFPEFEVSVHVLTYGFSPTQEKVLQKLRKNIYKFMEYCREHDLPTVLPHPLYFYSPRFRPPPSLFEKFALLFERFEVLNGQRDLWQNLLTVEWINSITPEKLELWGKKHGIRPDTYCKDPYRKRMTGGSDDHMGLFAGSCGTMLHVPNLRERLTRGEKRAEIALDVLRHGGLAPYGFLGEEEKLNVAFLDYFCQVALNMEDPGLVRMFLHRGSLRDKLMCLAIGNAMQEIKRHRYTMRFFRIFHEALGGKRPGLLASLRATKDYKPMINLIDQLAKSKKQGPQAYMESLRVVIPELFRELNVTLASRLTQKLRPKIENITKGKAAGDLVRGLELPSHLRALFAGDGGGNADMTRVNIGQVFDNLSFPALAAMVIAGSTFTSSKVLYSNRRFLDEFSEDLKRYQHPHRALWLTDTFADKNGVSSVLQSTLAEVERADLPIDFLVCHHDLASNKHLRVVKPVGEFSIPGFPDQVFRVPDLMEIQRIFREGGYDRIICSTEFMMGPVALYLRKAFSVPAYFYMHTDWLDYFTKNTNLDERALDRVRRILRALYKQFEGVFVLNSEHRQWLESPAMNIPGERIHTTAHWTESRFWPKPESCSSVYHGIKDGEKVLLYVGRISEEKGVMELPEIYEHVRETHPDVRLVLAGTGPAEKKLKQRVPDAVFLGWVDKERLPVIYSSADILLLPSRFDTFGCVVLEALSCALPVAAYDTKGPRDILKNGVSGLLSNTAEEMAEQITELLADEQGYAQMKRTAFLRSDDYRAGDIMKRLLEDVGLCREKPISARLMLKMATRFEDNDQTSGEASFFAEILEMVNVD